MDELAQNARRTGASKLTLTVSPPLLVAEDDGRGVAEARALIELGRSAWSPAPPGEEPEGTGLFALVERGDRRPLAQGGRDRGRGTGALGPDPA